MFTSQSSALHQDARIVECFVFTPMIPLRAACERRVFVSLCIVLTGHIRFSVVIRNLCCFSLARCYPDHIEIQSDQHASFRQAFVILVTLLLLYFILSNAFVSSLHRSTDSSARLPPPRPIAVAGGLSATSLGSIKIVKPTLSTGDIICVVRALHQDVIIVSRVCYQLGAWYLAALMRLRTLPMESR